MKDQNNLSKMITRDQWSRYLLLIIFFTFKERVLNLLKEMLQLLTSI